MNLRAYLLCSILISIGTIVFGYKLTVLSFPLFPDPDPKEWLVETKISAVASQRRLRVRLQIPPVTERQIIIKENFLSEGSSLASLTVDGKREVVWSRKTSPDAVHELIYQARIRLDGSKPEKFLSNSRQDTSTASKELVSWLSSSFNIAQGTLAEQKQMVVDLAKAIWERKDAALQQLDQNNTSLFIKSLQALQVPVESSHGILLIKAERRSAIRNWLHIQLLGDWHLFNLDTLDWNEQGEVLHWWQGLNSLIEAEGVSETTTTISVSPIQRNSIFSDADRKLSFLTFETLSVESQAVFRLMLLLPLGGLLIAIFRSVIGLQTFGIFMPALIALALRETGYLPGLTIFVGVVLAGVAGRNLFEGMKLLVVSRLAATLTLVILILVAMSIVFERFAILPAVSISLFPMVILTMTIERMAIIVEEVGLKTAVLQGFNSLLAASLVFLVISSRTIEHIFFTFPELLLFVLAAIIIVGRYTGYRLTELFRFRSFNKG
jgi:hypothetical protein